MSRKNHGHGLKKCGKLMIKYEIGCLVYDRCDADKTPGVIIDSYCGKYLIWFEPSRIYWAYYKELSPVEVF